MTMTVKKLPWYLLRSLAGCVAIILVLTITSLIVAKEDITVESQLRALAAVFVLWVAWDVGFWYLKRRSGLGR